jgi:hypothetical protein
MWVLVLCLGTGQWAHALVAPAAAPTAEHCSSHDTMSSQSDPVHTTDCCKVDAGGCSCAAASAIFSLPLYAAIHDTGFSPVAAAAEPHSADLSAVFRPPI